MFSGNCCLNNIIKKCPNSLHGSLQITILFPLCFATYFPDHSPQPPWMSNTLVMAITLEFTLHGPLKPPEYMLWTVRCVWLQTHVIFLLLDRSLADMRSDWDWYERKYWAWSLTSLHEMTVSKKIMSKNSSFCNKLQRILPGLMSSISYKTFLFIERRCSQCFIHQVLIDDKTWTVCSVFLLCKMSYLYHFPSLIFIFLTVLWPLLISL